VRGRLRYAEIDPGIRQVVRILAENGVETCQSCAASGPFGEGSGKKNGDTHSYPEPTVDFIGSFASGFAALEIALSHALPVSELRRVWRMNNGEPEGPIWSMTFHLHPRDLVGWLAPDCKPYKKVHGKCWCGVA
jgi:hypothetical protein